MFMHRSVIYQTVINTHVYVMLIGRWFMFCFTLLFSNKIYPLCPRITKMYVEQLG